ncbi:MAG: amino acid permease [Deltaproteobacteria bacterium]|nr:MAG: amino acid permease [Deltaproteobacteria bacterium]
MDAVPTLKPVGTFHTGTSISGAGRGRHRSFGRKAGWRPPGARPTHGPAEGVDSPAVGASLESPGSAAAPADALGTPPRLGAGPATALVAGSMLGIGIFIAPPVVAAHAPTPAAFLLVWILGGLSALAGALSVAELGAMMPRAGGDYPYLRVAYGPQVAFAVGWLQLLAIFPGSLATMAAGTATFQLPVLLGDAYDIFARAGLDVDPAFAWAVLIVVGLSAVNHVGIVLSGRTQVVLTTVPVALLLVASIFVLAKMGGYHPDAAVSPATPTVATLESLALAFLPVYFAYSGWNAAIFVGAEIREPGRSLPRALVGGTLLVTGLYLVLCVGFLAVFPLSDLARVGEAGTAAAGRLFGTAGEHVVTTLILLAMLGSINGTVLTGSRIAFAMGRAGHAPRIAGRLHPRHATPVVALWGQAAWSVVLLASQSFEALMNYTSAAMLITGTLTVLAVVVLRRRDPQRPRPYRVLAYPLPPVFYAGSSILVLVLSASKGDPSVLVGIGYFAAAWVAYGISARRRAGP